MKPLAARWREVGVYRSWDQADAVRLSTLRDTPSLDVRVRDRWGEYIVEVTGPQRRVK